MLMKTHAKLPPLHAITYVAMILIFIALVYQLSGRVQFPWDKLVWAESPFLTDMIKLTAKEPVFSNPDDGNSFVYSPGLLYLSYAILKPFELQLDIRFCRLVSLLLAVFAAAIMGWIIAQAVPKSRREPGFIAGSMIVSFLVLAQNFNVDIPHPDNLHIFHAVAAFALCFIALKARSFAFAMGTVFFAGLGMLTKQSGVLTLMAVAIALLGGRCWSTRQYMLMALIGSLVLALASIPIVWTPEARFYAFEVLAGHVIDLSRYIRECPDVFLSYPHRVILLVIFGLVLVRQIRAGFGLYHWVWVAFALCLLPLQVVAFAKEGAGANSWTMIDAFVLLFAWPAIGAGVRPNLDGSVKRSGPHGFSAFLLVIALYPVKEIPNSADYRYNLTIEREIRNDLNNGRRILLAHGTSALVRAGYQQIPIDRANSIYETIYAGLPRTEAIERRIRELYYDRIYLDVEPVWYGLPAAQSLASHYILVDKIEGPRRRHEQFPHFLPFWHGYLRHGYQVNFNQDWTFVLEPREKRNR